MTDVSETLLQEESRELKWSSWTLLLLGALSLAAGVIVIVKPGDSLATLAVIAGIFVLADGILELFVALSGRTENRGMVALMGVLSAIVGVLLIRHPISGVAAVALLLGLWLIVMGVVRFIAAFEAVRDRGWRLVVAAVEVIAGVVIVASPTIGYATLALLVGIAFILNGVGLMLLGWAVHVTHETIEHRMPPGRAAPAM
jgi:uncharacterized membrane protein HdeD (DUF308 family)